MTVINRLRATLAALAVCATFSAPASANLIQNGSFESGTAAGWTVGGDGIDVVFGWNATDGNWVVDLNAFNPGSLAQTIATVVGQTYVLEFDLSGNFSTTSMTKTMVVAVDGEDLAMATPYSFAKPAGWSTTNMFWNTDVRQTFVADSELTTISFVSTVGDLGGDEDREGVALDSISVTAIPVPAPAALGLLAFGLAGIGFTLRRKLG